MYKESEIRAATIAPKVLQLVHEDPNKAYQTAIAERMNAQGEQTNNVQVKYALDFLITEGHVVALPPTKATKGGPSRLMHGITLRGIYHLASYALSKS
jgi:hypothetical protein